VFALRLIFPCYQIVADTSVCAQPHIPLLSDTREYRCSRSGSYSPPLRYSEIPVCALSLTFPSSQMLANTSVRAPPHIPLLSETRKYQCWRSASYSRFSQNTSVRDQPHIPLLPDTRKYQSSRSAPYSPPLRYSQIPVFALSLIFPSAQGPRHSLPFREMYFASRLKCRREAKVHFPGKAKLTRRFASGQPFCWPIFGLFFPRCFHRLLGFGCFLCGVSCLYFICILFVFYLFFCLFCRLFVFNVFYLYFYCIIFVLF
jgi:hypothetical protein